MSSNPTVLEIGAAGIGWLWRLVTHPDVGTLASLVGAVTSLYVLKTVREVKRRMFVKSRFPALLDQLEQIASTINTSLNDYNGQKNLIDTELAKCRSNLGSIASNSSGNFRATVKGAGKRIDKYLSDSTRQNEAEVRGIYVQLNLIMQDMVNLQQDFVLE